MFDFSFAELFVVAIVAFIALGPQEMLQMVKNLRKTYTQVKRWVESYWQTLVAEYDEPIAYIKDLEDNWQPTYDIEEVVRKIEAANDKYLPEQHESKRNDQNAA